MDLTRANECRQIKSDARQHFNIWFEWKLTILHLLGAMSEPAVTARSVLCGLSAISRYVRKCSSVKMKMQSPCAYFFQSGALGGDGGICGHPQIQLPV